MGSRERLEAVCRAALKRIKPSQREEERDEKIRDSIYSRIMAVLPESVGVELAGSMAKGTYLKDDRDFDFFLLFPKSYSRHEVEMLGLAYARNAVRGEKHEVRYAEHPYLSAVMHGCRVDIVPSYRIDGIHEKGTSVDRSQLHTRYVKGKLLAGQKDEVRLLKQFMKNIGVYGAELRVEGFSGYACELLVLEYGGFLGLLEAAGKWEKPQIDIEDFYSGNARERFSSPLVLIDPVDRERNVAAVVSETSLSRFVLAGRQFLKKPSLSSFFSERVVHSREKLRRAILARKADFVAFEFPAPDLVEDILWPQLKKTARACIAYLEGLGFRTIGHYFWSDGKDCLIFIEFLVYSLPAVRKVQGPAVFLEKDVEKFLSAHKGALNTHVEHDRMVAIERRGVCDAKEGVSAFLKDARRCGVPENFLPFVKKARLVSLQRLLSDKYIEVAGDYYTRKIE